MNIVPELSFLEELDPTHVCKVPDCDNAAWGIENGWIYSYADHHNDICFEDCELTWPVYEEALGG